MSLKYANSSKILINLTNQEQNNEKGLGCSKSEPLSTLKASMRLCLITHCAFIVVEMNTLRGIVRLLKELIFFSRYTKQKENLKKGPSPNVKNVKQILFLWTKKTLITSLSAYWKLKLKWISKANRLFIIQQRVRGSSHYWFMDSGCSRPMTKKN